MAPRLWQGMGTKLELGLGMGTRMGVALKPGEGPRAGSEAWDKDSDGAMACRSD